MTKQAKAINLAAILAILEGIPAFIRWAVPRLKEAIANLKELIADLENE